MDTILNEVCVLVTAAFALTLVPGFRRQERSLLSIRDQGTALLVFLVLGLIEEATVSHAGLLHERIVAVCAAGLAAGPWVGLAVAVFVTWVAVEHHGLPLDSIAPMLENSYRTAIKTPFALTRTGFAWGGEIVDLLLNKPLIELPGRRRRPCSS